MIFLDTGYFVAMLDDRPRVHALLAHLRSTSDCEVVSASAELFEVGLKFHRDRPEKIWSLTDYISFVVMNWRRVTQALAYDHHFEQAGFEALLRRDPV